MSERAGFSFLVTTPKRQRSTPSIELFSALDSKTEQMLLHSSQTQPGASTKRSLPRDCGTMCSADEKGPLRPQKMQVSGGSIVGGLFSIIRFFTLRRSSVAAHNAAAVARECASVPSRPSRCSSASSYCWPRRSPIGIHPMRPGDPNKLVVQAAVPHLRLINHIEILFVDPAVLEGLGVCEAVPQGDGRLEGLPSLVAEVDSERLPKPFACGMVHST